MRPLAIALAAALTGAAGPARAAPAVTLNGVPIDGATGQRIENATVVIDEKGAVHIEAAGYAVKTPAVPGARPPAPAAIEPRPATGSSPGGTSWSPSTPRRGPRSTWPSSSTPSGSGRSRRSSRRW